MVVMTYAGGLRFCMANLDSPLASMEAGMVLDQVKGWSDSNARLSFRPLSWGKALPVLYSSSTRNPRESMGLRLGDPPSSLPGVLGLLPKGSNEWR